MAARLEFGAKLVSFRPGRARTLIVLEAETGADLSAALTELLAVPSLRVALDERQLTLWDGGAEPRGGRAAPRAGGDAAWHPAPASERSLSVQEQMARDAARPWTKGEEFERLVIGGIDRPMGWWLDRLGVMRTADMTYDKWLRMVGPEFELLEVSDGEVRATLQAAGKQGDPIGAHAFLRLLAGAQVSFAGNSPVRTRKSEKPLVSAG